jgi:hypothetical protein
MKKQRSEWYSRPDFNGICELCGGCNRSYLERLFCPTIGPGVAWQWYSADEDHGMRLNEGEFKTTYREIIKSLSLQSNFTFLSEQVPDVPYLTPLPKAKK